MDEKRRSLGAASEAEQQLLSDLDREAFRSELLRAKLIAGFCAILCPLFLLIERFMRPRLELLSQHPGFGRRVVLALVILMIYELILARVISRRLASGAPGNELGWRYMNAVLELALPTTLVYSIMDAMHPVYGLLMPPMAFYFFFIVASALRLEFGVCVVTGVAAAADYMLLYFYGISHYHGPPLIELLATPWHHVAKAMIFIVCGVTAGIVTSQLKLRVTRSLRLVAERNRVTAMFGLYVSPSVVETLMDRPDRMELGGELRNVCVLFLDIRNFTQFAEKRSPEEVVKFLNSLFSFMIDIITEHNGIINKFLGDGFMAVFGAPLSDGKECSHAMRAALAIVTELDAAVARGELPQTRIGIGIHYGPALTGSIGSTRRKEYTIIGDTVNLASRIEQLSKQHHAQILVSDSVLVQAPKSGILAERIGEVAVRGREAPLELYKLA